MQTRRGGILGIDEPAEGGDVGAGAVTDGGLLRLGGDGGEQNSGAEQDERQDLNGSPLPRIAGAWLADSGNG